jgi:membrane associated rhomboid family serine protease
MFPLWDDVPSRGIPVINFAIIALCAIAFLVELAASDDADTIVREYGMIPLRLSHPAQESVVVEGRNSEGQRVRGELSLQSPIPAWLTVVTSMFLHGGWMHLIGNMWFLYIFGDNVEDRLGHIGYVIFYLLCGVIAALIHALSAPSSYVPTVGASGAIAGVMGSYLLLYPRARVMTLLPFGIFSRIVPVPAVYFLSFWFLLQVVSGVADQPGMGGVAWWAHIGGFAAGLGMTWLVRTAGFMRPEFEQVV